MSKLYLDCEYNGHGSPELISLAIAATDGASWYGLMPRKGDAWTHPWVAEHVMPKLLLLPPNEIYTEDDFRRSLHNFLHPFPNAHIYADWPADFEHFTRCLAGPTYEQALDYQCVMHLIKTPPGEPKPEVPHNALSDAIALMHWHTAQQ